MDVVVVGGGIGGLATAIALAGGGARVTLFERAPKIEQVGAGIGLAPNALRALDRLGVASRVVEKGHIAGRVTQYTWHGEILAAANDASLWVHRADLQGVLLDAIEPSRVYLNSTFIGCAQRVDNVTARFHDGSEWEADLLIGADGLKSAVRSALFDDGRPRHTGSIAWRGVTSFSHPSITTNTEIWGLGSRFGIFQIGNGKVYWYGTKRASEGFAIEPGNRRRELLSMFEDWMDPIPELIEATPEASIFQTDMYDRRPIRRWSAGRVVLLGDAAHPMTADLGQGCAQVLEDTVGLLDSFEGGGSVREIVRRYEKTRVPRANKIQRRTHLYNRLGHLDSRVGYRLRNELLLKHMPMYLQRRRAKLLDGAA